MEWDVPYACVLEYIVCALLLRIEEGGMSIRTGSPSSPTRRDGEERVVRQCNSKLP